MLIPDVDLGRRWLAAHPPPGRVLLCAVSGAHLYGFPSPDSDLDLKGVHLAPTRQLLGLRRQNSAHDALGMLGDTECDLTTNEAGDAVRLLLAGNGNMLERILYPWQLVDTVEVEQLGAHARGALSRRFAHHYGGFFRSQCTAHERQPTTKTLAYTWRVALTGIHLLRTGQLVTDLGRLADVYGRPELHELITAKADGGEHGAVPEALDRRLRSAWPGLAEALSDAEAASALPGESPNRGAIEDWLVGVRLADLNSTN